jgi:GPH family glycoside/pentoside/hexuronide:cation symporter
MFIFLAIRNGMLLFYFQYYLDLPSMTTFMNTLNNGLFGFLEIIGLAGGNADAAGSVFGITNIFGQLAAILGIVLSNVLTKRMGKRNVFIIGLLMAIVFAAMFYIVPPTGILMVLILQILFNFSWGITMPVPWAMMADVADYSDWKYNRRSTAIVFAGVVIGLKVGLAIGGAISSMLLSWYGYVAPSANVARVAQTLKAVEGIRLSTSIYPVLAVVIMIGMLFFYKITKSKELEMQNELAERRKNFSNA